MNSTLRRGRNLGGKRSPPHNNWAMSAAAEIRPEQTTVDQRSAVDRRRVAWTLRRLGRGRSAGKPQSESRMAASPAAVSSIPLAAPLHRRAPRLTPSLLTAGAQLLPAVLFLAFFLPAARRDIVRLQLSDTVGAGHGRIAADRGALRPFLRHHTLFTRLADDVAHQPGDDDCSGIARLSGGAGHGAHDRCGGAHHNDDRYRPADRQRRRPHLWLAGDPRQRPDRGAELAVARYRLYPPPAAVALHRDPRSRSARCTFFSR